MNMQKVVIDHVKYRNILMSEQYETLYKIAKKKQQNLFKLVGTPIENEPHEKFLLDCSYSENKMTKVGDYWDIPQYCNGTTRHAKTLFRIANTCIGGGYAAQVGYSSFEDLRKESEYEKVLIVEDFGDQHVEIVWTWYWKEWTKGERAHGAYFISVGEYYLETRVDDVIITREWVEKYPHFLAQKRTAPTLI